MKTSKLSRTIAVAAIALVCCLALPAQADAAWFEAGPGPQLDLMDRLAHLWDGLSAWAGEIALDVSLFAKQGVIVVTD